MKSKSNTEYKIEKNIPLAVGIKVNGNTKYPFSSMEVGDSFAFPDEERQRVSGAASWYGLRHNKKFSISGAKRRCWRTA